MLKYRMCNIGESCRDALIHTCIKDVVRRTILAILTHITMAHTQCTTSQDRETLRDIPTADLLAEKAQTQCPSLGKVNWARPHWDSV